MEKYSRIFMLQERLYAKGLPIIISAGALLKNNETNQMLVQLKIRNISNSNIKAIRIKIIAYDIAHRKLDDNICYEYLDLNIQRDVEFGQKIPIVLSDNKIREFDVMIEEVIYEDNTVVSFGKIELESLEQPQPLQELFQNTEIKYFVQKYGENCVVLPKKTKDLWFCTCGKINHSEDENCIYCGNKYFDFNKNEYETFQNEIKELERLEKEKKAQEEIQRQHEQKRKKKKNRIIVAIVLLILMISLLLGLFIKDNLNQQSYLEAQQLFEKGYYEQSLQLFTELGNYEDSRDYAKYTEGLLLLADKEYVMASQTFSELEDYKDSALYAAYAEGMRITIELRPIKEAYLNFLAAESVKNAESYAEALKAYMDDFVGTYRTVDILMESYIIINEDLEVETLYTLEEYDSISYSFVMVGKINSWSSIMVKLGIAYSWTVDDECELNYEFKFSNTFDYFESTYSATQTSDYYEQITEEEFLIAVEAAK